MKGILAVLILIAVLVVLSGCVQQGQTGQQLTNTTITGCINDDGYCRDGCINSNDNDCEETTRDISLSGPIVIKDASYRELYPECSTSSLVLAHFTIASNFPETVGGDTNTYIDNVLVGTDPFVEANPGTNEVYTLLYNTGNIDNKQIKIVFNTHANESSKTNNEISETLGYVCHSGGLCESATARSTTDNDIATNDYWADVTDISFLDMNDSAGDETCINYCGTFWDSRYKLNLCVEMTTVEFCHVISSAYVWPELGECG